MWFVYGVGKSGVGPEGVVGVRGVGKQGGAGVSRLYQALEIGGGKVGGSPVVEGVMAGDSKKGGGGREGRKTGTVGMSKF
jgi:hypothetical protein